MNLLSRKAEGLMMNVYIKDWKNYKFVFCAKFPSSGGVAKFPEIFDGVVLKCILF